MKALSALTILLASFAGEIGNEDPTTGATVAGQSAADVLREFSSSDAAFLPAGLLKANVGKEDLAQVLAYPKETLVVVQLSGQQVREALERSVAQYPDPNVGFLQLSGIEVTFRKEGTQGSKLISVTVNGGKLDDVKQYEIAMPTALQRGQLGYWNIWEKAKTVRTYHTTLSDVLKGRRPSPSSPRWQPQG